MPSSTNPDVPKLKPGVAHALRKRKLPTDDEVVDTIAIVAAGYLEAMGGSIGIIVPPIPEKALILRLVRSYHDGHKPYPPTKRVERTLFKKSVTGLVKGMRPAPSDTTIETLAWLALGAWDETDLKAMKTWIVGYIVSLFKNGLD